MARFGYLYLNGGQWDGEQIIPKQWVEDSVSPHTPGYGYQWWLRDVNGVFVFSAVGQGGQHNVATIHVTGPQALSISSVCYEVVAP